MSTSSVFATFRSAISGLLRLRGRPSNVILAFHPAFDLAGSIGSLRMWSKVRSAMSLGSGSQVRRKGDKGEWRLLGLQCSGARFFTLGADFSGFMPWGTWRPVRSALSKVSGIFGPMRW